MTKEMFHEEELKILRKKSKTQTLIGGISSGAIIILLAGALLHFGDVIKDHEGRISTQEAITTQFLDNSGGEFIARSVTKESEERIMKIVDKKVDKTAFDIMMDDIKYIKEKLDD